MEGGGQRSGHTKAILGLGLIMALLLFALPLAAYMKWVDWPWIGPPEHIRLAAYQGDVGVLEWIAKDFNFYEKAGIEVDIRGYSSGKEAVDALIAGEADIATASEFVVATDSRVAGDLRIVGNICHYRNKGIVGRRDRGIATPADLEGKRIGVTVPSGAEYSLSVFLALNHLTFDDITTVALPPTQLIEAIIAGNIDAAITWQPHVQTIEKTLAANAVSFSGDAFDVYLLLIGKENGLRGSERALRRLLHALLLAEDWTRNHPEQAKAYIVNRFGVDSGYAEAQWQRMQLAVNLPQEMLVAMDSEARWLARRQGKSEADIPNFASLVSADQLRRIKPAAVTVLPAQASLRPGPPISLAEQSVSGQQ